jgi:hypothetical protein
MTSSVGTTCTCVGAPAAAVAGAVAAVTGAAAGAVALRDPIAYTASLERLDTYLRTELEIIFTPPLVMLKMTQGR